MIKRIFGICAAVCILICCLVVPASAANVYDSHILMFDGLTIQGYDAPVSSVPLHRFPFLLGETQNGLFQTYYGDGDPYTSWGTGGETGDALTSSSVSTTLAFYEYTNDEGITVTLYNDDLVIPKTRLTQGSMVVTPLSAVPDWNVEYYINGYFVGMSFDYNENEWTEERTRFGATYTGTDGFDLISAIRNQIPSDMSSFELIRMADLQLTIRTESDDNPLILRFISSGAFTNYPYRSVTSWLGQYDLAGTVVEYVPSDPSGTDFTGWLATAIGGFLSTELWPGFSIDALLYAMLAITLVLMFLKVFK